MNYEDRSELFIKIQSKLDELMDLVDEVDGTNEFMSLYCFGINADDIENPNGDVYEYFTGFSADNPEEIKMMLETVAKNYLNSLGQNSEPTDSIDYWLNI